MILKEKHLDDKMMVQFIVFLRCFAALIITNAHYTGIYPTDIIANGGLIGDILFFTVSGYCLVGVKGSFSSWYSKRLLRIYPAVILMTVIYAVLGFYDITPSTAISWFVYPTYYHFVASIIILYIPYYLVMKIEVLRNRIPLIMLLVFIAYLIIYIVAYDTSVYHIDKVREPMIRFLFGESMLLGAYFRQNDVKFRNNFKYVYIIIDILLLGLYFFSKTVFSKYENWVNLQVINQVIIFILLYFLLKTFSSLDSKLVHMPALVKKIIRFISDITLEIYIVQYILIDIIRPLLQFPINWIILTGSIIISAYLLHTISDFIIKGINIIASKIFALYKRRQPL